MRILLTGAAGFLGSHLCDRLLADDHEVVGLDNFLTGSPENLSHLDSHPGFTFIRHDVTTPFPTTGKVEAVLHFASPASPSKNHPLGYPNLPIETLMAGAHGTHHCLELCQQQGARFLMASTSEVYGDPDVHPQEETYWGRVNPVGPRSMYDEAKRFAEAMTMAYHQKHGVDTHIARIFNTYGPRMQVDDGRVVPNFLSQALRNAALTVYGNGAQTRSFCYVDDLIDGLVRLLMADSHEPVNIGSPNEITIREFAELVNQLTGNQAGIVSMPDDQLGDDPQRRRPDIRRARRLLGWEPQISLEDGLARTIPYFRGKLGL
ncbi:MAG: SDR family oxidoreductase [Anaerolineales bacterium]|nr:SDR family oxidoreductase [Anaerolineales bacterium]